MCIYERPRFARELATSETRAGNFDDGGRRGVFNAGCLSAEGKTHGKQPPVNFKVGREIAGLRSTLVGILPDVKRRLLSFPRQTFGL